MTTSTVMPGRRPGRLRRVTRIVAAFLATALAGFGLLLAGSRTSYAAENMGVCASTPASTASDYGASFAPSGQASFQSASETFGTGPGYSTASPTKAVSGYGYVFIDKCGVDTGIGFTDPHVIDYQLNSAGFANKVNHTGTGTYLVYFTGLGLDRGVAHVTTWGGGEPDQCRIGNWGVSGFDEVVTVYCYDINGYLTDRRFTASYTDVATNPGYGFGYLWANSPTSASYTPSLYYQYSTAGAASPNTIVRTGTGQYQVTMTGISTKAEDVEDVMVSSYGLSAGGTSRCRVMNSAGQSAWISCTSGGTPVDSMFTLTYVNSGDLLGAPNAPFFDPPSNSLPAAYAWVVGNGGIEPDPGWRFTTPAASGWTQSYSAVSGLTTVTVPTGSGRGNVEVVAFGAATAACDLYEFGDGLDDTPDGIDVQCYDSAGHTIPGQFNLFYTGKLP